MASHTGDYTVSIQLGSTVVAHTVVTLSGDGKYDNCTDKTTRPMFIVCEGGGDGDYVNAWPPQPGTVKAKFGAACAVDSVIGATTGGKVIDYGVATTYDAGWTVGRIMNEAAGADLDVVEITFDPMYFAAPDDAEG